MNETQQFESGAQRSKLHGRRDLIPKAALDAMGRRLELGTKYGENNWRKGGEDFRKATINHLIEHIFDYVEHGNRDDTNTDAIICNAAFLCHYEEESPFKGAQPGVPVSDVVDVKISLSAVHAQATTQDGLIISKEPDALFLKEATPEQQAIAELIIRRFGTGNGPAYKLSAEILQLLSEMA